MHKSKYEFFGMALVVFGALELAQAAGYLTTATWQVGMAWIITGVIVMVIQFFSARRRTIEGKK